MMSTLFEKMVALLHQEEVPLVLLRMKDFSESSLYDGDFDFYLDPIYRKKLLLLLFDFLSKNEINFFIDQKKYGKTKIFIFQTIDKILQIEIWHYLEIKSPFSQVTHYITPEQVAKFILHQDLFYSLEPTFEALYYISHLYTKSKNLCATEVKQRLLNYLKELKKLSSPNASFFENLLVDNAHLKPVASEVFLKLQKNIGSSLSNMLVTLKIKFLKTFYKSCFTVKQKIKLVPVLGPDGVGKTTFIEALLSQNPTIVYYRFKKLFRKSLLYKLRFYIVSKNNLDLEKNQVDELMGEWPFLSALSHYPFLLVHAIFGTKNIFSDRFFHDYLLKGVRLHQEKLTYTKHKNILVHLIPNTHSIIQLDAPSETILKRKQELNHSIICSYREHIFHLILDTHFYQYFYFNTQYDAKILAQSLLYLNKTYS